MRRRHRAAHRRMWLVLAVLLPILVIALIAMRPRGPDDAAPVRLAPPVAAR